MPNVAALKKKAAEFELKKQLDKAVATYQEILAAYDAGQGDSPDVSLYNRVGDLLVRVGNVPEAVAVYERAVDLYENGGFFNNAIALCNKILRTSPGRAVVYYKLGKISAAKGFKGDAKQNFLEYADRMRNAGDEKESFRALKEFAQLCPDQDDFRLMLAEQLRSAGRTAEAVEQLQQLYARYTSLGRDAEAEATAERLRAIDPTATVSSEFSNQATQRHDLVFLDLDTPEVLGLERTSLAEPTPAAPAAEQALSALPMLDVGESLLDGDDSTAPVPPRRSSVMLADSVSMLRAALDAAPDDHGLRREYAEALLDRGDRDAGITELQAALDGFERSSDFVTARSVLKEILRLEPESVRHHEKLVENTYRANDAQSLVVDYLALADALMRDGQPQKAQVVYQRVLEIAPDDPRPREALNAFAAAPEAPQALAPAPEAPAAPLPPAAPSAPPEPPAPPAKGSDGDYVSLGDWLREDAVPKSTRMVVGANQPSGDEKADFADMLQKFKQGVAENVDDADTESHYDLGVAFKEMGLLDEAIAQFQKALRGTAQRVATFEALGQCFIEKGQLSVAHTILQRAINEPGAADEQLVGVLYLIASVCESLGKLADARGYFERVFAVDIQFRDVGDRLNALDQVRS
jgi:tetratricopeptide (TPR) repeat protein